MKAHTSTVLFGTTLVALVVTFTGWQYLSAVPRLPAAVEPLMVTLASGAPTDTLPLQVDWTPSVFPSGSIKGYRIVFWIDGVVDNSSVFIGDSTATSYTFTALPAPVGSISEYRIGVQAEALGGTKSEWAYYLLRRQGPGALDTAGVVTPRLSVQLQPNQWVADSFEVILEQYGTSSSVISSVTVAVMRSIADSIITLPPLVRGTRYGFLLVPYAGNVAAATMALGSIQYERQ